MLSLTRWRLYLDLIRWDRPAGWLLLLWPTLAALWLAAGGFPGWHLLAVFIGGTILMRSAGCCVNDVADRDFDRYVKRTAQRPVTTGAVGVKEALLLGALLALLSFALVLTTNLPTVLLSVPALAVAIAYPFTKRFLAMPQAVLGLAFSFGIPMAFSAVQGVVPPAAWGLVLANLFWVLAYDTAYAMVDRDDDLKIGIRTSAITLGAWDVPAIGLFLAASLGLWAGLGVRAFGLGLPFLLGMAAATALAGWQWLGLRDRSREAAFAVFRRSHWLGACCFAGLALDFALR